MREISFEEHKSIQLEILKYFAEFCEKNGLEYFLAYGTLIGAVRHKGFIPWDDDTDVHMPRHDYDRMVKEFNIYSRETPFRLVDPYSAMSRHSIVKIIDTRTVKIEPCVDYSDGYLGVDIDVFAIDGQPDSNEEYMKYHNKLKRLYKKHAFSIMSYKEVNWIKRIVLPLIKLLIGSKKHILIEADKIHKKYNYGDSQYVGSVCCLYTGMGDRYRKEWFEGYTVVSFEGYEFRAPKDYDKCLKAIYGDYMVPPPVSEQKTHHSNKVYWK